MNRNHLAHAIRQRLKRYPAPHDNHYGVVPLPPTEEIVPLKGSASIHRQALEAIGRADALAQTSPDHFLLSRILVRQEAVMSSAIEGTHSTLDALLESEATDDPADPPDDVADDSETKQVKSYALTLERRITEVERNRYDAFHVGLIRDLQREVVKDQKDYKYRPGEIRQHVVYIGGTHISRSTYNPSPPADIHKGLLEHVAYLRCDGLQQMHQSIITRMAVAHAHFEAIHPFPDGNGRVGRLLLPLMMAADSHTPLYLAPHIAARKSEYMTGLKAAQQRLDYDPLVDAFSHAIVAAVEMAEAAQKDLSSLQRVWRAARKWRRNSGAERTLVLLTTRPVVTRRLLASMLKIAEPSAGEAIGQLVDAGILKERTGYKRNRIFVAPDVLRIFNRSPQSDIGH